MKIKRIYFLAPYPFGQMPSQRFRFEQYLQLLNQNNFKVTLLPFLSQSDLKLLKKGLLFQFLVMFKATVMRLAKIPALASADRVFIHRESSPVGPPITEWLLAKVFRRKIIFDFDDAIWTTDRQDESVIEKLLRFRSKVAFICRLSHKVSAGNEYLASYARRFSHYVHVNPTTIDTERVHNPALYSKPNSDRITIGWTGSRSTLKYLVGLQPVLKKLEEKYPHVRFLVIADEEPLLNLQNVVFRKWSRESEIADLYAADIGIMPLPDDEWSRGKCGFKALQYMALNIPAVASPVGVNTKIIENSVDGFLCQTENEWFVTLEMLILDKALRENVGLAGRRKVKKDYSVESNSRLFLSLFQ